MASSTAGDVKFSGRDQLERGVLALELAVDDGEQLVVPRLINLASSVSAVAICPTAAGVAAALRTRSTATGGRSRRPARRHDAAAHRQHVGVVVLGERRAVYRSLHKGGAGAVHLVGGDLLALAAAAEDDARSASPLTTPRATPAQMGG